MFKVTCMKCGVVWDAEHDCPLATFKGGEFQTNDKATADKLKTLGFAVNGDASNSLADMTVKELLTYSEKKSIDIGGATKKSDILAAIQTAEADNE